MKLKRKNSQGIWKSVAPSQKEFDDFKNQSTQQLADKVTKDAPGSIPWAMAAQDFREQITGGNTAVVGVNAVLKENIVNGVVGLEKTDFAKTGVNLLNKSIFIPDKSLNVSTGEQAAVTGAQLSPFIAITKSGQIVQNKSAVICFYDASGNFISGEPQVVPYVERVLTPPADAATFRTAVFNSTNLNTYQVEYGTTSTPYQNYNVQIENLQTPERSQGQLNMKVPSGHILTGRQITVDWATKKMSGNINAVYYDDVQILPTNPVFDLSILMNITSWLYFDLVDGTFKTAVRGTVSGKILLIMEIYATTTSFYYYTPYRPSVRLINYNGTDTQYIRGAELQDGTVFERSLSPQIQTKLGKVSKSFLSLNDAFVAWSNNEKFPIAFYGDSTTDGVGTTGWVANVLGQDSPNVNAYPKLMETKLRQATGNSLLRVYNAGFSGKTASWGLANFDAAFLGTSAYVDTKMIGISWGINDRALYSTVKAFRTGFKSDIKAIVEKCYANNIQPFLVTTQMAISPGVDSTQTQYPLRDAASIETIANEVKRELAEELVLELIDTHDFTERFVKYSQYSAQAIIPDKLHFGNVGHEYEAQLYFAKLFPRTNWINKAAQLDYTNQRIVTGVPENKLSIPATVTDNFKVFANYAKADAVDTLIYKAFVFNDSDSIKTLKAYKSDGASSTYVKVNGVSTTLDTLEKTIGTLDIGLHTLEVYSGASATVDFKGFKLE